MRNICLSILFALIVFDKNSVFGQYKPELVGQINVDKPVSNFYSSMIKLV